jgi:hypothetical protein
MTLELNIDKSESACSSVKIVLDSLYHRVYVALPNISGALLDPKFSRTYCESFSTVPEFQHFPAQTHGIFCNSNGRVSSMALLCIGLLFICKSKN